MTLKDLEIHLDSIFPKEIAFDGDFCGFIEGEVSNYQKEVHKILVTLDLNYLSLKKAIEAKVDLIITHHPFIFGEKEEVLLDENKRELLLLAKINKIDLYAIHTNCDFADNGISQKMTELLSKDVVRFNQETFSAKIDLSGKEILTLVKNKFELKNVNSFLEKSKNYTSIVVASGANGLQLKNIDSKTVLIVGELKWHDWQFALNNNRAVIEIGHFTEEIFIDIMKEILEKLNFNVTTYYGGKIYETS